MDSRHESDDHQRVNRQLVQRLRDDPMLWAKLAALWHRERVRASLVNCGSSPVDARHRANEEALDVARNHGWRGTLAELKQDLGHLVASEIPRIHRDGGRNWEERTHSTLLRILSLPPDELRTSLESFMAEDARKEGSFAGHQGLYRLAFVLGYVPTMDDFERRNAFLVAMSEIGNDRELCDRMLYRIVLRLARPSTFRPFESRLGVPTPRPRATKPRRRGLLDRLGLRRD